MLSPLQIMRGLRFRLTLAYVLLFGALLVAIGLAFRNNLQSHMEGEIRLALEDEWSVAKGYLRIENYQPIWTVDIRDPEDSQVKARLASVLLLTDADGNILLDSPTYRSIGIDSPKEIRRVLSLKEPVISVRYDANGDPYLIKAGNMPGQHKEPYYFAIGRPLKDSVGTVRDFTRYSLYSLPVILAVTSLLGWIVAGRVIQPVNAVAQAAQTITGSNLSLHIPLRGAGDELDHLIESFNRMTERLNESFEQIRRFSTDVSHELRTPLTVIRGQLEVALFTAETPEQYREAMVNALEDVEQLSSIVRALLLLSQAESGQLALQKAPLDLGKVAVDVVDQFQIPAEEKRLHLSSQIEPEIIVMADRVQIERLLSNLLSNAVKYTPAGGSVHVEVGRDGETWGRIEVRDTGVGIPEENLPHIFDRFYRVRNPETNAIQGLGLGLSFVHWIVKAHGGQIAVGSAPGKGSCFTVKLPAETAPAIEAAETAAAAVEPRV
jgi:heavy metal sensor kinase